VACPEFGGEVLACDSTQVYRGFDIGTAKPTHEEREGVRASLLDLVDPGFAFTAENIVPGPSSLSMTCASARGSRF